MTRETPATDHSTKRGAPSCAHAATYRRSPHQEAFSLGEKVARRAPDEGVHRTKNVRLLKKVLRVTKRVRVRRAPFHHSSLRSATP